MWRVEPEKVAGRLCLDGSHANAFGYRQYGCRLEPAQDATLRPHVRMLKCIAWEKFLPFNHKRSKPFCSALAPLSAVADTNHPFKELI
jgi:hypothetical protein